MQCAIHRRAFLTAIGSLAGSFAAAGPGSAQTNGGLDTLGLRGALSASEFGVLPNQSDDQSSRFQAMVDAAAARGVPIFLPAGTYVIDTITLPDGLMLYGVGSQTLLVPARSGTVLVAADLERLTLHGLGIEALGRPPGNGREGVIDLRGVSALRIEDVTVSQAGDDGLHLRRCAGVVTASTVRQAGRFALFAVDSAGLTIQDNWIAACANGGIIIHRSQEGPDGTIVARNRITDIAATNGGTGQWGNAINVFRADDVLVTGNRIKGAAFSAIRGNAARNIQIVDNNCQSLAETAIYSEFGFENAIVSRNFIDGAANGISVTNFNDGGRAATVTGNVIRNIVTTGPYQPDPPGFGIGISVEADTTVSANVIDGADQYGINAGWGPYLRDCVIASNVIRNARVGIGFSAAPGAGTVLIKDNVIHARQGAIRGHRWADLVTDDLTTLRTDVPANAIIDGNSAT